MLQDHFYRKKMGSWWRMRLYLKKELVPYESIPKDAKLKKTKKYMAKFMLMMKTMMMQAPLPLQKAPRRKSSKRWLLKKSWLRFVFATGMETGESGSITYREDL